MRLVLSVLLAFGLLVTVYATGHPGRQGDRVDIKLVRQYLDRMQLKYVAHPKNADTVVVPITETTSAQRVDLYAEVRSSDSTVVLSAYPKLRDRYFSVGRAADREKLFQKLLEINFRSFATFFVDEQGDIGARFTFTTEDGLGYDSFSTAVLELSRIADEYSKTLDELMKKEKE
jgi:hypothetical protein